MPGKNLFAKRFFPEPLFQKLLVMLASRPQMPENLCKPFTFWAMGKPLSTQLCHGDEPTANLGRSRDRLGATGGCRSAVLMRIGFYENNSTGTEAGRYRLYIDSVFREGSGEPFFLIKKGFPGIFLSPSPPVHTPRYSRMRSFFVRRSSTLPWYTILPLSITYARSLMSRAKRAFCSVSSMVTFSCLSLLICCLNI